MAKFSNEMNISQISMSFSVKCFCTIGKSLCTYEVEVLLKPTSTIPDYLEVQDDVLEMNNHWYTMEAACEQIFNIVSGHVNGQFQSLRVSVYCADARHFPVEVVKEESVR